MTWSKGPAAQCELCDEWRVWWRVAVVSPAPMSITVVLCRSCWQEWMGHDD